MTDMRDSMPQGNIPFDVFNSMGQGVLLLDSELRVRQHNLAFRQLLNLPDDETCFVSRPFADLLESLKERGEFSNRNASEYIARHLEELQKFEPIRFERTRPNGVALSVAATPLSAGGYLYVYHDISRERWLSESLRRSAKASVIAMANLAEHRDMDTGIHVLRVARLIGQTARKLMAHPVFAALIDESFIDHVATASILHDVGKISTPDQILLKAGALSPEERETIKQHSRIGEQLIRQAKLVMGDNPYLEMGAEIALTHHEWFNGGGYPTGSAGYDIPLPGRICAVVDVFDALISPRPYKKAWTTDEALALIRKQRGIQFDPDIVDAFIEVIDERETVCLVRWDDSMCVGNTRIDDQHRILIDTINQLASADSLHNHHAVAMIIDELLSYAAYHFNHEEKLMDEARYTPSQLAQHKQSHRHFVEWVNAFRDDFVLHDKGALGEPVLDFLQQWLRGHILDEDKCFKAYLDRQATETIVAGA